MEESYLCQRCRSVDWDAAFASIPYEERRETRTVLEFRSTLDIRPDSRCRLCLAIASLFKLKDVEPTNEFDKRFSLVAVNSEFICQISNIDIRPRRPPFSAVLNYPTWLIGRKIQYIRGRKSTRFSQHGVIVENRVLDPGEIGFEFGRPRRTVDFDRLRRWLSNCRRCEPCARPLDLPGMRVIDCELREIVPLPAAHPEYATLSYVWGQSEAPRSTDGKLSDRLPLAIEDSITVCRELGVRYLWVDRYCIQESHKHALIRSMHQIYRESQFTVVAAAGCGPEYGLPGVSSTPRSATTAADHPIRVGARQLSYIDNIESHSKRSAQQTADSTWAKRGWTLQEGMLSKRLCIFLDDEVHIETSFEAQSERVRPCERTQLGPQLTYLSDSYYWQTVSTFCSRDLSYPEDALNAMSGILSTWTQNSRTFRHIGGLAVEFDSVIRLNESLLRSLAWRASQPVPRRRCFPSWAWTGWLKPEVQQRMNDRTMRSLFVLDSVETDDREIIHYTQLLALLRVQHKLLDSVKILHITAAVIDICIGPSENMPSIDQHLCGDQKPKSEWRVMIVSDGIERVYECEITKLVTKGEVYLSTSYQYIQCKGLRVGWFPTYLKYGPSVVQDFLVMVWDEDSGYYERFGILSVPDVPLIQKKVETIRLG